jgi:hypothetical protein
MTRRDAARLSMVNGIDEAGWNVAAQLGLNPNLRVHHSATWKAAERAKALVAGKTGSSEASMLFPPCDRRIQKADRFWSAPAERKKQASCSPSDHQKLITRNQLRTLPRGGNLVP